MSVLGDLSSVYLQPAALRQAEKSSSRVKLVDNHDVSKGAEPAFEVQLADSHQEVTHEPEIDAMADLPMFFD